MLGNQEGWCIVYIVVGLDPAGPMFDNYPSQARLQPGDANLVDVIHTMGREGFILDFGTLIPLGHIDIYPAGGGIQPGCINKEHLYGDNEVTGGNSAYMGRCMVHGYALLLVHYLKANV